MHIGKNDFVFLQLEGQSGARSFFLNSSWYSISATSLLMILLVELYSVVVYQLQHINQQGMMIHYLFENSMFGRLFRSFTILNFLMCLTTFDHQSTHFHLCPILSIYVICMLPDENWQWPSEQC